MSHRTQESAFWFLVTGNMHVLKFWHWYI